MVILNQPCRRTTPSPPETCRRALAQATDLELRTLYTEDWCVPFIFLISLPLAVAAWLEVGPIAGVAATVWVLFMLYISSQPGAALFGPGAYSSASRSHSDDRSTDTEADP
jgi:hypothetical protein